MLSELATVPIFDHSIPLIYVLIPLVILIASEIISSFLITKFPLVKKLLIGNPSYVIKRGKLDVRELSRLRMGLPELLGELRLKDVGDISEVEYAVLEDNGKLSVLKKGDILSHAIIIDGVINESALLVANKSKKWLTNHIEAQGIPLKKIFLLTVDDNNNINIIIKEEK